MTDDDERDYCKSLAITFARECFDEGCTPQEADRKLIDLLVRARAAGYKQGWKDRVSGERAKAHSCAASKGPHCAKCQGPCRAALPTRRVP